MRMNKVTIIIFKHVCRRLYGNLVDIYWCNIKRRLKLSIKIRLSTLLVQIVLRLYLLYINESWYISALLFDFAKYSIFKESKYLDILTILVLFALISMELLGCYRFHPTVSLLGISLFKMKHFRKTI